MAAPLNRKWPLDTNVLIDLAADLEAAWTLLEIAKERGYSLHITKRVLVELADLALHGSSKELRFSARRALQSLGNWEIAELPRGSTDTVISAQFSAAARHSGLLPQYEVNDGVILAEASLGGAALLISGDNHIHGIDQDALRLLFEIRDMHPLSTISPMKLCSLFATKGKSLPR